MKSFPASDYILLSLSNCFIDGLSEINQGSVCLEQLCYVLFSDGLVE